MAGHSYRNTIENVERDTEEGVLWDPEELIEELLLSGSLSDFRRRQLLLMQVALAVDRNDRVWLSEVAGFCFQVGFNYASEGWVERHIAQIPDWARLNSGNPRRRWRQSARANDTMRDRQVMSTGSSSENRREEMGRSRRLSPNGGERTGRSGRREERCGETGSSGGQSKRGRDDDWVLVEKKRRKEVKRISPIRWEEVKIRFGEGCWNCGDPDHYKRDCRRRVVLGRSSQGSSEAKKADDRSQRDSRREREERAPDVDKRKCVQGDVRKQRSPIRAPVVNKRKIVQVDVRKERSPIRAPGRRKYSPRRDEENVVVKRSENGREKARPKLIEREEVRPRSRPSCSSSAARRKTDVSDCSSVTARKETSRSSCSSSAATYVPSGSSKFRACPIPWCKGNFVNRKGHVYGYHYPTALAKQDRHEGEEDTELRINALRYLAGVLVGSSASIQDLLDFLNAGQLDGLEGCQVDEWIDGVVVNVARMLGLVAPMVPTFNPINSPGCIFHYKVMMRIVGLLGERGHYLFNHLFGLLERRSELRRRIPLPTESPPKPESRKEYEPVKVVMESSGNRRVSCSSSTVTEEVPGGSSVVAETATCGSSTVSEKVSCTVETQTDELFSSVCSSEVEVNEEIQPMDTEDELESPRRPWRPEARAEEEGDLLGSGAIDSHFHLDRLCSKLNICMDYRKALDKTKPKDQADQVNVAGAVAVFCDPWTYPTREDVEKLKQQSVVSVIGLHPGRVNVRGAMADLKHALEDCPVVGLGEVGLDGTKADFKAQKERLGDMLLLLRGHPEWVLVLHCRPDRGESASAAYYHLFYQCKYEIPKEQKIHLHCFNGSMEDVDLWLGFFPNTYFGFTNMVAHTDFEEESQHALKRIDSSRLLLESDAPYFNHGPTYECSSPAFLGMTASKVAEIRKTTREEILKITAENAKRLYWQ